MEALLIIGGLFALYLLLERGGGISSLVGGPSNIPQIQVPQESYSGPSAGNTQQLGQLSQEASGALSLIPIAGPAIAGIFSQISGSLLAASAQRRKQAINENDAVAKFIPAMDKMVVQIANAYNSGQVNGPQAAQLFEQIWTMYWSEVTPQIQPARNGCNGGASIPRCTNWSPSGGCCGTGLGQANIPNKYLCSGSWGAACCVGGYAIEGTVSNLKGAVLLADRIGSASGNVCQINPSSNAQYGSYPRPGYKVQFVKP